MSDSSYDSDSDDDIDDLNGCQVGLHPHLSVNNTGSYEGDRPVSSIPQRFSYGPDSAFVHHEMGATGFATDESVASQNIQHMLYSDQIPNDSAFVGQIQTTGYDLSDIDLQTLETWAKSDNFTILALSVSANMETISQNLLTHRLHVSRVNYLLIILKKVILVQSHQTTIEHVLASFVNSNFFDFQLKHFFRQVQHHNAIWRDIFAVLQNLFDVINFILDRLPQYTKRMFSVLFRIKEEGRKINVLKEGDHLTVLLHHLFKKVEQNIPCFQKKTARQRRIKDIPKPDEEVPPDNFSEMEIFPSIEELEASFEPFLRANKTTGAYRDVQHYTDVHFRLLREDYLSPIRNGLKDYKDAIRHNQPVTSQELRFYFGVQLVQMTSDDVLGITFKVKFDNKDLKDVDWERTNRFMTGALLCFSKDDFETVIFASVADHERNNEHAEGIVRVVFESNLEDVFTTSEYDEYVMAETVSFFESYRHVLEGLQEVGNLPLSTQIIHCKKNIPPPQYIKRETCFDFSPIMRNNFERKVQLLDPKDWPNSDETFLNDCQFEALNLALTHQLAIIQGPPGTGKTYIGLKVMELLLKNRKESNIYGPILVVCYTNHALDQFLEGILEFCKNGIVRVGGRSKSELLKTFNLTNLRKDHKINRHIKKSIEDKLSYSTRHLKKICRQIRSLWHDSLQLETNVLTVDDLANEMSEDHFLSLTDKSRTDGTSSKIMNIWMKAASANMEKHINDAAKKHLTKIIVGEGEVMDDKGLLSKIRMVRPDFETRTKIYRSWFKNLQSDLQNQMTNAYQNSHLTEHEKLRQTTEIAQKMDNNAKDIVADEIITEYMTNSDVYKCIKSCVEIECGEKFHSSYVKSWLFGYFRSTDQMLEAISRLSRNTQNYKPRSNKDTPAESSSGWVIEDSDGSDDNSEIGFNIRNDEDDSSDEAFEDNEEISDFKRIETDFKVSERKEILLLQKAKLLGIDLSEEGNNSEASSVSNNMTYSNVFRLIHMKDPYSEEDASSITDVWALSLPERYRLYKYWMLKKKDEIARDIIDLTSQYNIFLKMKRNAHERKDKAILKGAQVIGMTTTGAARNRKILKDVAPQIIVVEEAAEVLEAHMITTLNMQCKHLILIGDHQQLRPNPTVFRLAVDYNLEISLFERLFKTDMPKVILEEQHRMRPEVADYLRLTGIYPRLYDHERVLCYDDVRGITSNVFFLHHEIEERYLLDSTSKQNIHEAEFLKALCKYFLQQGYSGHQITVLAAYGGQVEALKEDMNCEEIDSTYENITIRSIDNYQGEENDIILVSLVRSNLMEEVGFLKINNRVCVALSRARKGLFVIGNLRLLEKQSKMWKQIVEIAKRTKAYGTAMNLLCVNHGVLSTVRNPEDFQAKVPEGGCSRPCNTFLACGHICPRKCHASDQDHQEHICHKPCLKSCDEGHKCVKKCHEECGLCEVLVEKRLTICGHTDMVACHEDENTAICHQQCRQKLSCGHICKGFCGNCFINSTHAPCEAIVQRRWPCMHTNEIECHKDIKQYPCPTKCSLVLKCAHKCEGTCGNCLGGRVHQVCSSRCDKILPCGHQCCGRCGAQCDPCSFKCPLRCRHANCSKAYCGQPCDSCMENCAMICKHQQCFERCSDECTKAPCKRKCPLRTICQHACASMCGEECVCLKCEYKNFRLLDFSKKRHGKIVPLASRERALKFTPDKDTVLVKIPKCDHVFTINQLDQYVNEYDPNGSQYIHCPVCENIIQGIMRYNNLIKARMLRLENRKQEIIESTKVSESDIEEYSETFELPDKELDYNRLKALKCHTIFASSLNAIERIHEHFNWVVELNINRWKNVLFSLSTRVTAQFIEELIMELHRLLILEQMVALKTMIDDAGHILEEPLKSRWKMKKVLNQKLDIKNEEKAENLIKDLYKVVSTFTSNQNIMQSSKDLQDKSKDAKDTIDCLRNL